LQPHAVSMCGRFRQVVPCLGRGLCATMCPPGVREHRGAACAQSGPAARTEGAPGDWQVGHVVACANGLCPARHRTQAPRPHGPKALPHKPHTRRCRGHAPTNHLPLLAPEPRTRRQLKIHPCTMHTALTLCPPPHCVRRPTNPLFDHTGFTRVMERALAAMWDVRAWQVADAVATGSAAAAQGVHESGAEPTPAPGPPQASVAACRAKGGGLAAYRRCLSSWSPWHVIVCPRH
jgi:hypothetical protein